MNLYKMFYPHRYKLEHIVRSGQNNHRRIAFKAEQVMLW